MACVHPRPAVRTVASPPPPRRPTLVALPVESADFPKLGDALTELLGRVRLGGIEEYVRPKVGLEVVQLSIECVDATPECYSAVGKSLSASKLLFARVAAEGRRSGAPPIQVTIICFDVNAGRVVSEVETVFDREEEALQSLPELIHQTVVAARADASGNGAHQ
jgi:hypothetical protein